MRITLLATVAVAITLVAAAILLVRVQREALTTSIERSLRVRADDIAGLVERGQLPTALGQGRSQVAAVQVLDAKGEVVAATANIAARAPMATLRPVAGASAYVTIDDLGIDDERFRVLARTMVTADGTYTLLVAASMESVDDSAEVLASVLWLGTPLVVGLVGAGSWLVVGRALAPVEAMRREVAAITATELDRRVPEPPTEDELGRLARTMNAMLARLEDASERQGRFVADASHELRSPLASLRTQIEVNLGDGDAGRRLLLAGLLEEVLRMQRLVDDLLLLARSEHEVTPRRETVDLDDIVLAEVRRAPVPAGKRVNASGVSAGQVMGDADQLGRVVRNLLENALRHARREVMVRAGEDAAGVFLVVEDDGEGVAAEDGERVFDRFSRADRARARSHGGTGLGLAITKAIVEGHGGTVSVDAERAGGAEFVVRLPAAG